MLTWYATFKRQPKPTSKVRAADYYRYTKLLVETGVVDTDLLDKMVADLEPVITYVGRNSALRDSPSSFSPPCPYCGDSSDIAPDMNDMPFFDEGNVEEDLVKQYRLNHEKLMAKHAEGYWLCEHCGKVTGWWEFMETTKDENGKWMYTDAARSLWDWFVTAQRSSNPHDRAVAFERIVEFVHGSGPQSNWFIDGGLNTIDRIKSMIEERA